MRQSLHAKPESLDNVERDSALRTRRVIGNYKMGYKPASAYMAARNRTPPSIAEAEISENEDEPFATDGNTTVRHKKSLREFYGYLNNIQVKSALVVIIIVLVIFGFTCIFCGDQLVNNNFRQVEIDREMKNELKTLKREFDKWKDESNNIAIERTLLNVQTERDLGKLLTRIDELEDFVKKLNNSEFRLAFIRSEVERSLKARQEIHQIDSSLLMQLNKWIKDEIAVSKCLEHDLDAKINEAFQQMALQMNIATDDIRREIEQIKLKTSDNVLSETQINKQIENAVELYNSDKVGLTDYALESAGGSIVSTRCSATYDLDKTVYKLGGIPIFRSSRTPRTLITPISSRGSCWPFGGSEGQFMIKLSRRIIPTAITYEHIPKRIAENNTIGSAPKTFQVYGVKSLDDISGRFLGEFTYQDNDKAIQLFNIEEDASMAYDFVEFFVTSNHGNCNYTCLYRIRVHGRVAE